MPTPDPLITELRTLRHMLGVRATGIAQQAGITTTAISSLENGRSNPSLHTLRAYAAAIGYELRLVSAAADDAHLLPLLDLTADEVQALTAAAEQTGNELAGVDDNGTHLRTALDKLRTPDADTYPADYDLDLCQPADTTQGDHRAH